MIAILFSLIECSRRSSFHRRRTHKQQIIPNSKEGMVCVDKADVFSEPNDNYDNKIGTLYAGTVVNVLEPDGVFYKINYLGRIGYIYVKNLFFDNEPRRAKVVEFARSRLGCKYSYGASGPTAFGAPEFIHWVYAQVGVSIPNSIVLQAMSGEEVVKNAYVIGDALFFKTDSYYRPNIPTMVTIYTGNGKMIYCDFAEGVVEKDFTESHKRNSFYYGARRYL